MAGTLNIQDVNKMNDPEVMISVQHIGKMYKLYSKLIDRLKQTLFWRFGKQYGRDFWALHDVSFEVHKGETVGILGRNGSGKSTLLQIVAGVIQPTEGIVQVKGKISALLELGSGFNPEYMGSENVIMSGAILGYSRAEVEKRYDEICSFADIGQYIDQPVKTYSSGMMMRLAFAVASCVEPDILIVDEALAVGDIMFQARCFEKIKNLRENGTTTLFVTHDTGTFQNLCDYGYILEKGRVFTHGKPPQVALQYYELMRETEHTRQRLEASAPEQKTTIIEETKNKEEEIKGKQPEGEYRFGTGTAKITDVNVINANGEYTSSLKVGEVFQIAIRINFYEKNDDLAVGFLFRNVQGQNLMGMHTYVENRLNLGSHLPGEEIVLTCEQTMLLNPGDYLLSIGLADHRSDFDFTSIDNRNNLQKISVYGKDLAYGLIHTTPKFILNGKLLNRAVKEQTWESMNWKDWTDWISERINLHCPQAASILEVGGVGKELSKCMPGQKFLTLNYPEEDICKKTQYEDNTFDLILTKMTFEHLYNPFSAANELSRILAPGGILILITVWSWRNHTAPNIKDYWRFSTDGLSELFKNLQILELGYDISDRRKDCRLDNVIVDELGGWREHWATFLVARKNI